MRALLLALLLVGCWSTGPEPVRYTVVRGDTLGEIATAHGVTVDQLRAWNGIEGDLIEVGQVLVIQTGQAPTTAPAAAPARRRTDRTSPARTAEAGDADGLSMPAPKPCLDPPTAEADGDGMATVASQGLTPAQVKAGIDAFVPRTTACLPAGWSGRASVQLDLTIGCDGLVKAASVHSGGGLDDEVLACLTERVRYASFPAHALPDGEQTRVPIHFASE